MCTYNGEKFLRQQLDTILAQTYPIQEIIIQDDHSTDYAREIIDCYTSDNWRVRSRFIQILVKNRNKIFYAPERNQCVAVLRAVTFPITMYDCFDEVAYKHLKEQQTIQNNKHE